MYIWTLILRNAFLGKVDLRLKCEEMVFRLYDKLKEILNIITHGSSSLVIGEYYFCMMIIIIMLAI
ncbi:hypothetical protein RhiirA4_189296 [Rhizophagus irregularis]|uniref:Uncharacterized protein n=1 Tax=Rhizophagus irregularis TaxID=588596 RepID=A0A2I1GIP4_9GLOM|nr:hypothetical protein RhiirA4_189296 [Rhizophagus irregularis]